MKYYNTIEVKPLVQKYQRAFFVSSLFIFAVVLRLFLSAHNWPATDSEEGTMGLEALNIAFYGAHPIYFYGQRYMGVSEAYLGAVMFHLFGVSLFSLRLGMVLLFTLFLVIVYFLAVLLYNNAVACITLLLIIGGTKTVLVTELLAVGGAVETLVCGSAVMLLASWLALQHCYNPSPDIQQKRRYWFVYGMWGIAAGLGLWSHLLVVPFVGCSALILIVFCWHDLRTKASLFVLSGLLIGALPLIIYNVTSPIDDNTIAIFLNLHQAVYPDAPTGAILWLKQLLGTFIGTLPMATGIPPIVTLNLATLPLYGTFKKASLLPMLLYGGWSLGYMSLLVYSTWISLKPVYLTWQKSKNLLAPQQKQLVILPILRLMLLACSWLTLLSYVTSATAAERPWSFRYLVGLTIVIPAIIASLATKSKKIAATQRKKILYAKNGMLILLVLSCCMGTLQSLFASPQEGNVTIAQQQALIQRLEQMKLDSVYSGYWVCDNLVFQSRKKVICAVLDDQLKPGLTRYAPDRDVVSHSKYATYIFSRSDDFYPQQAIAVLLKSKQYDVLYITDYMVLYHVQTQHLILHSHFTKSRQVFTIDTGSPWME